MLRPVKRFLDRNDVLTLATKMFLFWPVPRFCAGRSMLRPYDTLRRRFRFARGRT